MFYEDEEVEKPIEEEKVDEDDRDTMVYHGILMDEKHLPTEKDFRDAIGL